MKRPALTALAAASILSLGLMVGGAAIGDATAPASPAPVKERAAAATVTPNMTSIYLHGATAPIWVDVRQVRLSQCGPDGDCTATWQGQQVWARQGDVARARKAVTS